MENISMIWVVLGIFGVVIILQALSILHLSKENTRLGNLVSDYFHKYDEIYRFGRPLDE